jgi:hypothetical protein
MKSRFTTLFFVLFVTLSSFTVSAPESKVNETTFEYFRVHRQGKEGISLTWASQSFNTIEFRIERSYDGEFFEQVHYMMNSGEGSYKYNDASVFPGIIYYRIIAVQADGSLEASTVESVRVVRRK